LASKATPYGAGRANEGLRADWQQQPAHVKKECGYAQHNFQYVMLCTITCSASV